MDIFSITYGQGVNERMMTLMVDELSKHPACRQAGNNYYLCTLLGICDSSIFCKGYGTRLDP